MFQAILKESKVNKNIIGIRFYNDDDNFWCGYIEDFNERIFKLRHFDKYGREDGIVIASLEKIESVEIDQDYQRVFNYLARKENDLDIIPNAFNVKDEENWVKSYLLEFQKEAGVVSFETASGDRYYGIIDEIDNTYFIVRPVENHGQCIGKTAFKFEDIEVLRWGDIQSKFRWSLYQWRTGQ